MDEFNEWIDTCGLKEVKHHGNLLSWCNGKEGKPRKWARLDWALMNVVFSARFNKSKLEYAKRKSSNHSPLVLRVSCVDIRYGPSPFQFQKMWCFHEFFHSLVQKVWEQPTWGSGLTKLAAKLKRVKLELRSWNRNVFVRVKKDIQDLEKKLTALQFQLQANYSDETDAEFIATKMELDVWEKREETRLAQAAKKKWSKEGDRNSNFFHAIVS
ncbi:uncharacterized protein LOC122316118 [Carya illinoinensis]|uniref:uncharacterized protein LOC122316118 n=1 Tax=Carya illinoinensis TaxID=32201 RepID=UPI001C720ABB|nr:uncharacterized protein LOC122316118 [Carya illinoinensis]